MKKQRVTIVDIAKQLNISPSTVSRALHNHPAISRKTKQDVLNLAKILKYHPNLQAINLLRKKTNTIGVIVPDLTRFFYSSIISGIQDFFTPLGYNLILGQTNESYKEELKMVNTFASIRVDGFLVAPASKTYNIAHLKKLKEEQIPLVIFDRDCEGLDVDKVFVDEYSGAFQAVDYLIKTGCHRIAHIAGASNLSTSKHRMQGYLDALSKNNIAINDDYIVLSKGFDPKHGAAATKKLLRHKNQPDGIFAVNDSIAIGAMYAINEAGLDIPGQISVVGFDDIRYSAYIKPSLTTVWQPVYEMGLLSARILSSRINDSLENQKIRVETLFPELVLRGSSKQL